MKLSTIQFLSIAFAGAPLNDINNFPDLAIACEELSDHLRVDYQSDMPTVTGLIQSLIIGTDEPRPCCRIRNLADMLSDMDMTSTQATSLLGTFNSTGLISQVANLNFIGEPAANLNVIVTLHEYMFFFAESLNSFCGL